MEVKPKAKLEYLSWADFPEGWDRFFLNPTDVRLEPQELFPGVYLLVSSKPGVNHTGFVVGQKGVFVIDAHINPAMARQIQEAIKKVTNKPLLFLVNANHHGDHTFGNCAFPEQTLIVQHRRTAELVPRMEEEKAFLMSSIDQDPKVFEDVELRRPDIVFDDYLRFDLGGITVEIHHFGPANSPGDTITYVPEARIAWTGNSTSGAIVLCLWTDAPTYIEALSRMGRTLALDMLIPSHTGHTTGEVIGQEIGYLMDLNNDVLKAIQSGWTLEQATERIPIKEQFLPPPHLRGPFNWGYLHQYNVTRTYKALISPE